MASDRPPDVLSSLPRTRPHRRSAKRGERPAAAEATPTAPQVEEDSPATATGLSARRTSSAKAGGRQPKAAAKTAPAAKTPRAASAGNKAAGVKGAARAKAGAAPKTGARTKPKPKTPAAAKPKPKPETSQTRTDVLGTAVQAAAEIAEIGLSLSARAVRRIASRLPRP